MITAKEARERMESPAAVDKVLALIENEISVASGSGRFEVTWLVPLLLAHKIREKLVALGYSVATDEPRSNRSVELWISW